MNIVDRDEKYLQLPCQVAGVVPPGKKVDGGWDAGEWLAPGVGLAFCLFKTVLPADECVLCVGSG